MKHTFKEYSFVLEVKEGSCIVGGFEDIIVVEQAIIRKRSKVDGFEPYESFKYVDSQQVVLEEYFPQFRLIYHRFGYIRNYCSFSKLVTLFSCVGFIF